MAQNLPHRRARRPQKAPLHDYQRDMVDFVLDHPKCGLFLPVGAGKACDDETMIPTPSGRWVRLGDIQVGDRIFDMHGNPTTVLATYHHKNKPAMEVTLRDGRSFVCCDEHLIPYYTIRNRTRLRTANAADVAKDFRQGKQGHHEYKYRVPNNGCVLYEQSSHVIDPYMLGVLLGDGCLRENTLSISSVDEDVVMRAAQRQGIPQAHVHSPKSYNHTWRLTRHVTCDSVRRSLRELGLWGASAHDKFIPQEYLIDSRENRLELLKGLLDTDGSISVSHRNETAGKHGATFRYHSACERLANDVAVLARSLGYAVRKKTYKRRQKGMEYELTIYTHDTPMTCGRKLVKDSGVRSTKLDHDIPIVNVEPVEPRDMTCLTVDAPDHCFLINDFIVTHNTTTTLEAIWELDPMCHVLIIGPKPVIKSTWPDEMDKFGFNFRVESLIEDEKGRPLTPKARHEKYLSVFDTHAATIWMINREMVVDLVEHLPAAKNGVPIWPFRMVVIDEAQAFKSYNSKRFKALKKVTPQIARLVELTGTPSPNGLEDIWPLLYLIDEGKRLGPNITSYRNRWFYPTMTSSTGAPIGFRPMYGADRQIHDAIKDVVVSLPDVATKLPALIMDDHRIRLDARERSLYQELAKESLLEFTNGDEVVAPNAAVLVAKLSQLASGAIYVNGTHEYRKVHERKLEETLRIIEQAGSPVIVAYHFNSDKEMLLEYLRKALDGTKAPLPPSEPTSSVRVYDGSPEMVRQWNRGEVPVLMIQPASAGFGLNLQQGGHTLVWYTLPWSLEHYVQTNGRIYRQGQTDTTFIHRLMVQGTVDRRIKDALESKDTSQSALMRAVRLTKADLDVTT